MKSSTWNVKQMASNFYSTKYISEHVPVLWTKRFVAYRKTSIRCKLRQIRRNNRPVYRRPCGLLIVDMNSWDRKPDPFIKPQRQNFNEVYRPMQIRMEKHHARST